MSHTSSIPELSDKGESHEQQAQSVPQIQPTTPSGGTIVPQSGVTNPTVQYPLSSQPGTAHAMTPGAYPYPDPYYRSIFAPYENQPYAPQSYPGFHLQLMGIQPPGVPLPSDAVEEPVFVNAKQYHGILRRRQSRAKLESQNRVIKSRKASLKQQGQPYMHESRHLHALRRPRGCGGRFLNLKKNNSQQNDMKTGDRASEGNINLNSDKTNNSAARNFTS